RIRGRALGMLLVAALALLGAGALAVVLSWGLLDFVLRTPAWLRMIVLGLGVAGLIAGVRRWVLPALRFHPSLTEVALRLGRSRRGRVAGLGGVLASGLELARPHADEARATQWMAGHVVEDAQRRFAAVRASALLRPDQLRRALLALAGTIAVTVGL